MRKINDLWQTLTIKNKIAAFTITAFVIVILSVLFNVWMVKFLTLDLSNVMEDNAKGGALCDALAKEQEGFVNYVHSQSEEDLMTLNGEIVRTLTAIEKIQADYKSLGDERFAQLQSIRGIYGKYRGYRDQILAGDVIGEQYIQRLYEVYEMQDYLIQYAQRFSSATMAEGNEKYRKFVPAFFIVPMVAIALGAFLLFMVAWITRMLDRSIIKPILNLTGAARRIAANDFFIDDVETDRKDELGELVRVFNKMKYATGEYNSALEEKRAELEHLHQQAVEKLEVEKQLEIMNLELLRNQINPHFLFNTLNVIEGMANLEYAGTTEKMISALSSLFRYNLKNQDTEVLLSQELKVAQDYMFLQKMRFGDRVEYESECLVKAEEVIIPTFLFQPLMENAVVHGLSPKIEGGVIRTKIWEKDDKLFMEVRDTGVGMSEGTLTAIKENLESGSYDQVGIGIGNIHRRITTMYENAGMEMESTEGEGTAIRIYVPYRTVNGNRISESAPEKGSEGL
ncbi:MAG: sensor histidine kinase [Lachnospiraceae bacterium]|nr:sensor histidine kinase [Lachnospiraceae bacterium]